jgi:hypothetical protein
VAIPFATAEAEAYIEAADDAEEEEGPAAASAQASSASAKLRTCERRRVWPQLKATTNESCDAATATAAFLPGILLEKEEEPPAPTPPFIAAAAGVEEKGKEEEGGLAERSGKLTRRAACEGLRWEWWCRWWWGELKDASRPVHH